MHAPLQTVEFNFVKRAIARVIGFLSRSFQKNLLVTLHRLPPAFPLLSPPLTSYMIFAFLEYQRPITTAVKGLCHFLLLIFAVFELGVCFSVSVQIFIKIGLQLSVSEFLPLFKMAAVANLNKGHILPHLRFLNSAWIFQ